MRRSGIVMSVNHKMAIVMTKDGEFCSIPCTSLTEIGMEIEWDASLAVANNSKSIRSQWKRNRIGKMAASGFAAVVALAAGVWYYTGSAYAATPYAYVSVDINPSVSLVLNRHLHVIKALPQNSDGERLLSHLQLKGETIRVAVQNIVNAAVDDKMLPPSDNIIVAAAPAHGEGDVRAVQTEVQNDIRKAVSGNAKAKVLSPTVYGLTITNAVWKVATDKHVSPGKVGAVLLAQKHGMSVAPNDAPGTVLKSVMAIVGDKDDAVNVTNPKLVQAVITQVQQLDKPISINLGTGGARDSQIEQPLHDHGPVGIIPEHSDKGEKRHGKDKGILGGIQALEQGDSPLGAVVSSVDGIGHQPHGHSKEPKNSDTASPSNQDTTGVLNSLGLPGSGSSDNGNLHHHEQQTSNRSGKQKNSDKHKGIGSGMSSSSNVTGGGQLPVPHDSTTTTESGTGLNGPGQTVGNSQTKHRHKQRDGQNHGQKQQNQWSGQDSSATDSSQNTDQSGKSGHSHQRHGNQDN